MGERVNIFKRQRNSLPLDGGRCEKIDLVVFHVIPAKAGIQYFQAVKNCLDPGFHRGDDKKAIFSHLRGGQGGGNLGDCFRAYLLQMMVGGI